MGNKSSRYIKRYEHNIQTQNIQKTLTEVRNDLQSLQEETSQRNKRFKTDIKSLAEVNDIQKKALQCADREIQELQHDVLRLRDVEELKITVNKIMTEHLDDRTKLKDQIKTLIASERECWDNDIFEMKERYEKMRKYSMELISMDLAHEREIKDLQKQISFLQDKKYQTPKSNSKDNISQKPSKSHMTKEVPSFFMTPRESMLRSFATSGSATELQGSRSYDFKLSKINMAMKRLQKDLNTHDGERSNSSLLRKHS